MSSIRRVVCGVVLGACLVAWAETEMAGAGRESSNHLRYFGYFHVDGFPFGASDHFDQVFELDNTNVVIVSEAHSREQFERIFRVCAANGVEVLVGAFGPFFKWTPGYEERAPLLPDWQERWDALKAKLEGLEKHLLGFYFDEPYWNGIREEDFRRATKVIRGDYPTKRILICEAAPPLDLEQFGRFAPEGMAEVKASYYEFVTDAAFDCYAPWGTWCDYPRLLERLKSKLAQNQDIWLVPWAFTNHTDESRPEALAENLLKMYELAVAEPRCVGLLPFSFATGGEHGWGTGCADLFNPSDPSYAPELKRLHVDLGKSICRGIPYVAGKHAGLHDGEPVAGFDFDADETGEDVELTPFAQITCEPGEVISGAGSLLADTREAEGEWNLYLLTRPGLLKANTRYRLGFDYRIIERGADEGYFYFLFRSEKEREVCEWAWKSYTTFKRGKLGEVQTFERDVVLGPYDDYRLQMALHNKGVIVVDNVSIEEMPTFSFDLAKARTGGTGREPYEPYGMCLQAGQLWVYKSDEEAGRAVRIMADAGVQWIRFGAAWGDLLSESGVANERMLARCDAVFDEAEQCGIRVYLQLIGTPKWASTNPDHERFWAFMPKDLDAWRAYVRTVAERYGDRVRYWEVWNEQDWEFWESSLEDFVVLLRAAHDELKRINPDCRVLLGGLSTNGEHGWSNPRAKEHALQRLYDAGAKDCFDIMTVHTYTDNLDTGIRESIANLNTTYRVMCRNGDGHKRIWITEIGSSTNARPLEEQAAYLTQVYTRLLCHPLVDKVFWYNFRCIGEDGEDQQHNFGVVNYDFTPRPSYEAYEALEKRTPRRVLDELLEW